jgi:hypothetical protein
MFYESEMFFMFDILPAPPSFEEAIALYPKLAAV